jgi:hypothetical protein
MNKKLITSVRPLIIPKLKEENAKKNDKKPTRDYIHEDEFDVSVFLLPVTTRHSVLNRVCPLSSKLIRLAISRFLTRKQMIKSQLYVQIMRDSRYMGAPYVLSLILQVIENRS